MFTVSAAIKTIFEQIKKKSEMFTFCLKLFIETCHHQKFILYFFGSFMHPFTLDEKEKVLLCAFHEQNIYRVSVHISTCTQNYTQTRMNGSEAVKNYRQNAQLLKSSEIEETKIT